jgi:hypothetical protein
MRRSPELGEPSAPHALVVTLALTGAQARV